VLSDEGRTFVFVHKEGDYWIRRPVTLGKRLGDMVEVRSGLAAGQRIVTDGSFLLKSDVLRRKMGAGCAD
jgi:cobalt-zinc-cadmium efflux system membrane fusion protein